MRLAMLKKISHTQLIWLLTLIASLIAWRVLAVERGNINDDVTLYFEAARLFTIGQWQQGFALFPWPFYSLLIAGVNQVTSLHLTTCAQLLSIIFYAITCFSLSKIVQLAGGNKLTIIAVNALVWSSLYITGDVLGMLLRDVGFWAFFSSSIAAFILFQQKQLYRYALFWQGLMLLAMLFRIEAIGFVVLLPLIIFWQKNTSLNLNISHYLQANSLLLVGALGIFIAFTTGLLANFSSLGRLNEVNDLAFNGSQTFLAAFQAKSNIMAKQVLGRYLEDYANFSLIISLLGIVAYKTLLAAGLVPLILITTRGKQAFALPNQAVAKLLIWVAAIAFLNALIITFRSYVLSSRYVIAFGFLVIIFAAFAFANLYADYKNKQLKYKSYAAILLAASLFIITASIKNIAPKPQSDFYEQDAIAWVKSQAKPNSKIYYDSSRLRYYAEALWAGREDVEKFDQLMITLKNESVRYDYLLMRTKPSNIDKYNQIKQLVNYQVVKSFSNKSGNQIIILQHVPQ